MGGGGGVHFISHDFKGALNRGCLIKEMLVDVFPILF